MPAPERSPCYAPLLEVEKGEPGRFADAMTALADWLDGRPGYG